MSHDERPERCLLICRTCGDDLVHPFVTMADRGRWAAAHTAGTGHRAWFCVDGWPSAGEVAGLVAAHDAFVAELADRATQLVKAAS